MRYVMTLGLLAVLAIAVVAPAPAQSERQAGAPLADPYQVVMPVADTSATNRNQVFALALAKVMQRLGGHAPPAAALAAASTYVQQYQYARAPAGAAQPFQLVVKFAPSAIEHLEKTLAMPVPVPASAATTGAPGAVALGPAVAGGSLVWVSGLHSALDFADAVAALDNLPGVDSVGVRQARGDGMLLSVHASVPLARVLAGLGPTSHLTVSAAAHPEAAASLDWSD